MKNLSLCLILICLTTYCFAESELPLKKLVDEGNQLFKNKKYEEAIKKYEKGLSDKKSEGVLLYNLGNVYYSQSKFKKALENFSAVLKGKPKEYLKRNVLYHLGNTELSLAKKLYLKKPVVNTGKAEWEAILNAILITIPQLSDDIKIQSQIKAQVDDLVKAQNKEKILGFVKQIKEQVEKIGKGSPLLTSLNEIEKKIIDVPVPMTKEDRLTKRISELAQSIQYLEKSFTHYRKALKVARKIGVKEGRQLDIVGPYIKSNWALARVLWAQYQEEKKKLEKENLKLLEGIQQLIAMQERLCPQIDKIYLTSTLKETQAYNLKILAEFHIDYAADFLHLQKLADEEMQKKEEEYKNMEGILQKIQKQQGGKKPQSSPVNLKEKSDELKKLKEAFEYSKKISDVLKDLQGAESFVIDGLKKGNVFMSRRYAYRMLYMLYCLNSFAEKKDIILFSLDQSIKDLHEYKEYLTLAKGSKVVNNDEKRSLKDLGFKLKQLAIEKTFDSQFKIQAIVPNLNKYIKEFKPKGADKKEKSKFIKLIDRIDEEFFLEKLKVIVSKLEKLDKQWGSWQTQLRADSFDNEIVKKMMAVLVKQKFKYTYINTGVEKSVLLEVHEFEAFVFDFIFEQNKDVSAFDFLLKRKSFIDLLLKKLNFSSEQISKEKDVELEPYKTQLSNSFIKLDKEWKLIQAKGDHVSIEEVQSYLRALYNGAFIFGSDEVIKLHISHTMKRNDSLEKNFEEDKFNADFAKTKAGLITKRVQVMKLFINSQVQSLNQLILKSEKENKETKKFKKILDDKKSALQYLVHFSSGLNSLVWHQLDQLLLNQQLYKINLNQFNNAALLFGMMPKTVVDTLKLCIAIETKSKVASKYIVEKRMTAFINQNNLGLLTNDVRKNLEMVGIRAINQTNEMEAKSKQKKPTGGKGGQPAGKPIDYKGAIKHMKKALVEGEKVISFYEAKEFDNSQSKHDDVIDELKKALDKLQNKDENKDKKSQKNQKQKDDQKKQQQQNKNNKQDQKKQGKKKPLEMTPKEARRLLKELNKKDMKHQKKKNKSKKKVNSLRPW